MTAHISDDGLGREETVAEHTQKTTFLCNEKGKKCGLSQVMSLCGILHDLGKNKQAYNSYLHADDHTRRKKKGTIAHASTGAKYIYDMYHDRPNEEKVMVEMISYAVAAHHGLFDSVGFGHADLFSKKICFVDDYEEAYNNAKQDYLGQYDMDGIFINAADEFHSVWEELKGLLFKIKPMLLSKYKNAAKGMLAEYKFYLLACLQRLILSILIDSDWEATTDFMDAVDTLSKPSRFHYKEIFQKALENFKDYMQKKQNSAAGSRLSDKEKEIMDARNLLQKECMEFAVHPAGIYCLPVPTGGGKTLGSLAYALEFSRLHPETERIIYVSPYVSITEQNARVFRDAVGNDSWILEHHSSVARNAETEDEDYRGSKIPRLGINWEEPFICTTFVQFMNTVFSDQKECIRRMHRLVHAVVIFDEVQSMPLKCVHTFNYMINFLNAVCKTNVILCTATQPALEEAGCPVCYSVPKNMITNVSGWFRKFERVKINTPKMDQKYTFESLGREIIKQLGIHRSILVVLNTKQAVRKLYDILKAENINAAYLTTNLCAEHRSDRIASVKAALANKQGQIVVVSTNLIEAGVDISFELVYRSMAGLDSLAQTAGRCNRNGELDQGIVNLIMLEDENTGNMEELQQNIRVTGYLVHKYNQSKKTDSLLTQKWMDEYYKSIYFHASSQMDFPIEEFETNIIRLLSEGFGPGEKKNYMNQAYKTAGRYYRVIDDHSFGVIVPYKKGAGIIRSIQEAPDPAAIKTYIRQAQRYTVNVRESRLKEFDGLIQLVSEKIPGLYMAAAPGAYSMDYGITPEWETLIF